MPKGVTVYPFIYPLPFVTSSTPTSRPPSSEVHLDSRNFPSNHDQSPFGYKGLSYTPFSTPSGTTIVYRCVTFQHYIIFFYSTFLSLVHSPLPNILQCLLLSSSSHFHRLNSSLFKYCYPSKCLNKLENRLSPPAFATHLQFSLIP